MVASYTVQHEATKQFQCCNSSPLIRSAVTEAHPGTLVWTLELSTARGVHTRRHPKSQRRKTLRHRFSFFVRLLPFTSVERAYQEGLGPHGARDKHRKSSRRHCNSSCQHLKTVINLHTPLCALKATLLQYGVCSNKERKFSTRSSSESLHCTPKRKNSYTNSTIHRVFQVLS